MFSMRSLVPKSMRSLEKTPDAVKNLKGFLQRFARINPNLGFDFGSAVK
jgi:hypothetical protein